MMRRLGFARLRTRCRSLMRRKPVVAVLRLEGIIATGGPARQSAMNFHQIAPLIDKAFSRGKPKAVALVVNCPGGSPAQSSLIAHRIRELATEKDIPVHTFVEDLAASGGYWLAVAGDTIYLDRNSLVGSIGVISASFGLHRLLEQYGIERRLHTSGKDKSFLDPFQPQKQDDVEYLKEVQSHIHDAFISYVKERRGEAIGENDVFTGRFWVGETAIERGLADHIGHLIPVMKEMYGDAVKFRHYATSRRFLGLLGSRFMASLADQVEERLIRSQFGL